MPELEYWKTLIENTKSAGNKTCPMDAVIQCASPDTITISWHSGNLFKIITPKFSDKLRAYYGNANANQRAAIDTEIITELQKLYKKLVYQTQSFKIEFEFNITSQKTIEMISPTEKAFA